MLHAHTKMFTLLLVENIVSRKTRYAQTVAPYRCFLLSSLLFQIVACKLINCISFVNTNYKSLWLFEISHFYFLD